MRVVDLSHPVRTGMQVFPGDPHVRTRTAATVARDGSALDVQLSDKDRVAPSLSQAREQGLLPALDDVRSYVASLG